MLITEFFSSLITRVQSWVPFLRSTTRLTPLPATEPLPVPQPKKRRVRNENADNYGAFYYFDDVLEKLESYFKYLRYLKKDDRDTFDLYSRMGGQIVGGNTLYEDCDLPAGWLINRPSFGMIHFTDNDSKGRIDVKLAYYQKHKGHENLQPIHGDIYRVVLYYVDKNKPAMRYPLAFHIHISETGVISLLKERVSEVVHIKHRRRSSASIHVKGRPRDGNDRISTACRETWRVPEALVDLFKQHSEEYEGITIHEATARTFRFMANVCYNAGDGVRVNVRKRNMTAIFNVAMERTAYFFKDREKTVNDKGSTKRIFHVTRAHMRTYASGKSVPVRVHFKGERHFTWKDYQVVITVSGKHHIDINSINVASVDESEINNPADFVTQKQFGDVIRKHVTR